MPKIPAVVHAEWIGGHAWEYLTARSRTGRVVSRFSSGINLLFGEGEAFVPVQTLDVPLHPWAIQAPGPPLACAVGKPVDAKDGKLHIGSTTVCLLDAQIDDLRLPPISKESAELALRCAPLLAQFVEQTHKSRLPDPFQSQIDTILQRWQEAGEIDTLLDLIGLGSGSTPSGDDVLVGILAGLSVLEDVDSMAKEDLAQLRTGIRGSVKRRTSLPSAQMVLAACERAFCETVLELVAGFTSSNILEGDLLVRAERVAQLGQQSGLSGLQGLTHSLVGSIMLDCKTLP